MMSSLICIKNLLFSPSTALIINKWIVCNQGQKGGGGGLWGLKAPSLLEYMLKIIMNFSLSIVCMITNNTTCLNRIN